MSAVDPLTLFGIGGLVMASYQLFVTVRLIKFGGYSVGQKFAQALFIWVVPLIGAFVIHTVIRIAERHRSATDCNFTPQDPQSDA